MLHDARVLEARVGVEILLRHVFRPEGLVLQLAESAQFQEKRVERFRQDFHDHLAAQFSVGLFRGVAGRDVTANLCDEGCDLLHRVVESDDFEFHLGVADEFAVGRRALPEPAASPESLSATIPDAATAFSLLSSMARRTGGASSRRAMRTGGGAAGDAMDLAARRGLLHPRRRVLRDRSIARRRMRRRATLSFSTDVAPDKRRQLSQSFD